MKEDLTGKILPLLIPLLSLSSVSFSCCVGKHICSLGRVSCRRIHVLTEFTLLFQLLPKIENKVDLKYGLIWKKLFPEQKGTCCLVEEKQKIKSRCLTLRRIWWMMITLLRLAGLMVGLSGPEGLFKPK